MVFFFQPANITNQILNFGLPAPIDLQVVGTQRRGQLQDRPEAARPRSRAFPGAADVHVHQVVEQPELSLNVDRVKAGQMGLTQRDVTSSMLISLSGSNQVAPNFWLNPANGVSYNVGVQTPQYRIDSLDALLRTPVTAATTRSPDDRRVARRARPPANASVGASPSGASQAYGNPGAIAAEHAAALEPGRREAQLRPGHRQPLQRRAGLRRLRERRPPRPGRRGRGSREDHRRRSGPTCRAAPR